MNYGAMIDYDDEATLFAEDDIQKKYREELGYRIALQDTLHRLGISDHFIQDAVHAIRRGVSIPDLQSKHPEYFV